MPDLLSADLLTLAASGSREAQSALVDLALSMDNASRPRPIEALAVAEQWARCASRHGELVDLRRLASVLMMRANYERLHGSVDFATCLDAEALGLLDIAADDGDEAAGRALAEAAGILSAAPFALLCSMKAEA